MSGLASNERMFSRKCVCRLIDNSYALGYADSAENNKKVMLPVLNLRMMSDEEWNELARKNKLERQQTA